MTETAVEARQARDFWAVDATRVSFERGYICPDNPGYWWVPSLGFSLMEGKHLFYDEFEALLAARQEARAAETRARTRIDALTDRMLELRR